MPINILDYGDVYQTGENILAARDRRDPNSIQNRLLNARLNQLGQGPDPTAPMRNYAARQKLIESGATPEEIARFDSYVRAQQIQQIGGVPQIVNPGGDLIPLGTLEDEAAAESTLRGTGAYASEFGKQAAQSGGANPYAPVAPSEISLGVQGPTQPAPSAASLAAEKTKAVEVARTEAERESPDFQNKQAIREAESASAIDLIDEMLSPRKDGGGIYASYAYGRVNPLLPDTAKPQEWIDAEAKRDQVVSMLQLENVAKLKGTGPITEAEQAVLRQAMTVLQNPRISPELVARELRRVRAMFATWRKQAQEAQGKETKSTGGWTVEAIE